MLKVRIASLEEVPEGTGKECVAEGRIIAVFNVKGEIFAMDGVCPHAGGPIGTGQLNGSVVTCPWHGWQFDVCTGQHCLTQNVKTETFPTSVEDGDVFIELPE